MIITWRDLTGTGAGAPVNTSPITRAGVYVRLCKLLWKLKRDSSFLSPAVSIGSDLRPSVSDVQALFSTLPSWGECKV